MGIQEAALKAAGCDIIRTEKRSGTPQVQLTSTLPSADFTKLGPAPGCAAFLLPHRGHKKTTRVAARH
jgi:hypothetical protein